MKTENVFRSKQAHFSLFSEILSLNGHLTVGLYHLLVGWRRCGGRTNQVLGKNWPGYACCSSSQSHSPLLGFLYFFLVRL